MIDYDMLKDIDDDYSDGTFDFAEGYDFNGDDKDLDMDEDLEDRSFYDEC